MRNKTYRLSQRERIINKRVNKFKTLAGQEYHTDHGRLNKASPLQCNCRSKLKGNPKIGRGICPKCYEKPKNRRARYIRKLKAIEFSLQN